MIVESVEFRQFSIRLNMPFQTAKGNINSRSGIIVRAVSKDGLSGFGEISPLEGFSRESLEEAKEVIRNYSDYLVGIHLPTNSKELVGVVDELQEKVTSIPSVLFGLEGAIADLAARTAGLSLAKWLVPDSPGRVPVNAILNGSTTQMLRQLERKIPRGYSVYKVKVGAGSIEEDLEKVIALQKATGDDIQFRLDANQAWDIREATTFLQNVGHSGIEYIEEPLSLSDFSKLPELRSRCVIPIALDESLSDSEIVKQVISHGAFDVAVIKPTLVGGIVKSTQLSLNLAKTGVKTVISSTIETGVGLAHNLHLAASLSDYLLPCGLDTLDLLSDSLIADDLVVEGGCINLPQHAGIGVEISGWKNLRPIEE